MENNEIQKSFKFNSIQWTGSNKDEILKFSFFEEEQKCFFASATSLWLKIDKSQWRLEIGDYILKSEAGLIFYRQELP